MWTSEVRHAARSIEDHESAMVTIPVATTVRRLRQCGLTDDEAANLAARLVGLATPRRAWTVHEIEHLVFLRTLVTDGRLSA
jgi:hypothetical protein